MGVQADVLSGLPGGHPCWYALRTGLPVGRKPQRLCLSHVPAGWPALGTWAGAGVTGAPGRQRVGSSEGFCHRAGQGSVARARSPGPGGAQQSLPPSQLFRPEQRQVVRLRGLREEREEGAPRPLRSREGTVVTVRGQQGALRERAPLRGREVRSLMPDSHRPPRVPSVPAGCSRHVGRRWPARRKAGRGLRAPAR